MSFFAWARTQDSRLLVDTTGNFLHLPIQLNLDNSPSLDWLFHDSVVNLIGEVQNMSAGLLISDDYHYHRICNGQPSSL